MRYVAEYIEPTSGLPSFKTACLIRHYANDNNAFRFMHRHLSAGFPSGQYALYAWPEETPTPREVGFLYKLV